MLWIVWIMLALYALPLISILVAIITSLSFRMESAAVIVAAAIAEDFSKNLRETFGSLVVPLLTAFAIKHVGADEEVPPRTLAIFGTLAVMFLVSVLTHAFVTGNADFVKDYGQATFTAFSDVTASYSKEALTFIALTIGISLKKS